MMPEDQDYLPCDRCGDDNSETLQNTGKPLCERCDHIVRCGCGVGCDSCLEDAEAERKFLQPINPDPVTTLARQLKSEAMKGRNS